MNNRFEIMPSESRMWCFAFKKPLNTEQQQVFEDKLSLFCNSWVAHDQKLFAAFKLFYKQIFVLTVDETFNHASGCSIDKSVKFIEQLASNLKNEIASKDLIWFLNSIQELNSIKLNDIEFGIQNGIINENTLIIPTWVSKKKDWDHLFLQPAKQSWLAKYFSKSILS